MVDVGAEGVFPSPRIPRIPARPPPHTHTRAGGTWREPQSPQPPCLGILTQTQLSLPCPAPGIRECRESPSFQNCGLGAGSSLISANDCLECLGDRDPHSVGWSPDPCFWGLRWSWSLGLLSPEGDGTCRLASSSFRRPAVNLQGGGVGLALVWD